MGLVGRLIVAVWAGLLAAGLAAADDGTSPALPAEALRTAQRLADRFEAVARTVEQRQWSEAIEEYQRILDEAGDELVRVGPRQFVAARRLCQLRLTALPDPARKLYRARVDERASRWLEQGRAQRDPQVLRRLVDEAFCSRHTDQALDLLGDLAFERGQLDEALHWWRMLAPPLSVKPAPDDLVFPDPQVDVAQVRGKQVLALVFQGQREAARQELSELAREYPGARGHLAGQQGNYADILRKLLDEPALAAATRGDWPTFAGAPSRGFLAPPAARLHEYDSPEPIPLAITVPPPVQRVLTPAVHARQLAFHPVVVGRQVVLADARFITGYDLLSRKRTFRCDLIADLHNGGLDDLNLTLPNGTGLRYTLTADEDRVYVRMGAQAIAPETVARSESYLVCLALTSQPPGYRLQWQARARLVPKEPVVFEGTPLVHDGQAYVASTRFQGARAVTAIACFDALTGAPRWRQEVCAHDWPENEVRYRHHLLTLAGPNIVYCSHGGVVAAVDARTGRHAWAFAYPSRGERTDEADSSPRELAPCVYAAGRVYAAPADLGHILCLDAASGRLLWQSKAIEVLHLLGVARGRLIFTTAQRPRGIRAVDARTGDDLRHWLQPESGDDLPTFGRGLIAGDRVFWPTYHGLVVLDAESGQPVERQPYPRLQKAPDHPRLGNLALGHGCLVVADERDLWWHVPESLRLEQRRKEAEAQPGSARAWLRLALSEAGNGLSAEALAHFARAERLAQPSESWQEVPLRDWARRQRQHLLFELAERSRRAGDWKQAARWLEQAADADFAPAERLQALARLARLWSAAGQPARAVAAAHDMLADDLRPHTFLDSDDVPRRPTTWVERHVADWRREHGDAIYLPYEQQARKLLDSAKGAERLAVLRLVVERFPNSKAAALARSQLSAAEPSAVRVSRAPPTLKPPLECRWQIPLEAGEELVIPAGRSLPAELLFFRQGERLVCRRAATGASCWRQRLDAEVDWFGFAGDVLLAGGAHGVHGLRPADGTLRWTFRPVEQASSLAQSATERDGDAFAQARTLVVEQASSLAQSETERGRDAFAQARTGVLRRFVAQASPLAQSETERDGDAFAQARTLVLRRFIAQASPLAHSATERGRDAFAQARTGVVEQASSLAQSETERGRDTFAQARTFVVEQASSLAQSATERDGDTFAQARTLALRGSVAQASPLAQSETERGRDAQLSAFRLAEPGPGTEEAGRLLCLQGQRRLWALALDSGEPTASCWAPAARLLLASEVGRFYPDFAGDSAVVLLQASPGKRWLFSGGKLSLSSDAVTAAWPAPPLFLGEAGCVIADDDQVTALNRQTGGERWTWRPDAARLPGRSPQPFRLLAAGSRLVVQVSANYGCGLEALDLVSGREVWSRPLIFTGSKLPRLDRAAADGRCLYLADGDTLAAIDLADARQRWQLRLPGPERDWRVLHAGDCLVVYPHRTRYDAEVPRICRTLARQVAARFRRTLRPIPTAREWFGFLDALQYAQETNRFPVLLVAAADGRLLQRLEVPAAGARQQVLLLPDQLIVIAGQSARSFQPAK